MNCNECEKNEKLPENVPYIVYEAERARSQIELKEERARNERIFKKMWIAIIVGAVLFFASQAVWLWAWTSYDYVSYEYQQDGEGTNIIGDDNEVNNGAEVKNSNSQEEGTAGEEETQGQDTQGKVTE